MRRLLAILLILPSCSAVPPDPRRDAAMVLHQVLLAEAAAEGAQGPVPCVEARPDGVAFDDRRRHLENLAKGAEPKAEAEATFFIWRATVAPKPGVRSLRSEIDPRLVQLLSEAATRVIRAPRQAPAVGALDERSLPPPLRACAKASPRLPILSISAPAVSGDFAFVETGLVCGGLCGNGLLFALRRTGSDWKVVGVADTWIS